LNLELKAAECELKKGQIEAESAKQTRMINADNAQEIYDYTVELAAFTMQNALTDYEEAQEKLSVLDSYLPDGCLLAENDGVVTSVSVAVGDSLSRNMELISVNNYKAVTITLSVDESDMEAASKSNETLTMLLAAMAVIVFIVGGIGIMNVLFVSVRERTNEIGILKAIGCSRKDILLEFLLEAGCISLVGAVFGVLFSLAISPVIEQLSVRVELSVFGAVLSLLFGVLTGTMFGFYPAYKASRLLPVTALNQE